MTVEERLCAYAREQNRNDIEEEKLQQTIRKAKEAYWRAESRRSLTWMEFLYQQAGYIQKRWWFAQGALLLLLYLGLYLSESSIYERRCMGILAPGFAILILPELWKNRSSGAVEIEGASYYSLNKIYAARMLLFGMADVCLLSIFFIISAFTLRIAVLDILIQFLLPMNVTCCICFRTLYTKRSRNVISPLFLSFIWISVWTFIILRDRIYSRISVPVWMGLLIFSAIYLCYSIRQALKNSESFCEYSSIV
ncbi:hypothetical protein [Marvinbryantia formatexigens]|nr:hypothetical protein [Marvinbryantia formatexigens]UWO23641.1 hypothetical protein NQ534_14445 [Marvinbryantia formatexigens DSM 14469]SDG81670.1 hypothetical protein SAMN05660368_03317 [Marvinbryantia formatexigens]